MTNSLCAVVHRSERLEGDDGARVDDAGNRLHLLIDEMTDVGPVLDVKFHQKIEIARGRIDLRRDFGIGELVRYLIGLAELTFDLDEERNHGGRRRGWWRRARSQSSKKRFPWQALAAIEL